MAREKRQAVEVKVGDVWQSKGGALRITVEKIGPKYQGGYDWIFWNGVNRRVSGTCLPASFPRGRTLVERDGKAVGQ